ncbi:MAG: family 10 glycosylhydrolase [Gemmatimonadota bacterium]|nr:MAG: family 10 glycosylhydrolase [Gemmatimonadota bacterium]
MKTILIGFILCLCSASVSTSQTYEARAFWVVRDGLISEESISEMVNRIAQTHCNMIFVQVCGRGDAYYQSDILPRAEQLSLLGEEFDPLQSVIEQAHGRGLQVHAWINVYFVWSAPEQPQSKKHIFHQHPDWIAYTSEGRSLLTYERPHPLGMEGVFLSPGHPDVQEWIPNVIGEIVSRYDIDGIHLDYVRYPNGETDFNPATRILFKERYAVDPIQLFRERDALEKDLGVEGVAALDSLWYQWRCQNVTQTVGRIRRRIETLKPKVMLSAAVKPDYDLAVKQFGQDWQAWMHDGLLDFIVVMAYSPVTELVLEQIGMACQLVQGGYLLAGVGVYNQDVIATIQQIRGIRSLDVSGVSLFSYNSIVDDEEYFQSLKESSFRQEATVPRLTARSE